jgi:hypothetical protein
MLVLTTSRLAEDDLDFIATKRLVGNASLVVLTDYTKNRPLHLQLCMINDMKHRWWIGLRHLTSCWKIRLRGWNC